MYQITKYSIDKAQKLGLTIKPSTNPTKKIDVFKKDSVKVASCGALGYWDYPTYLRTRGKKYTDERRRLYRIRHQTDRNVVGSNGYYADRILW